MLSSIFGTKTPNTPQAANNNTTPAAPAIAPAAATKPAQLIKVKGGTPVFAIETPAGLFAHEGVLEMAFNISRDKGLALLVENEKEFQDRTTHLEENLRMRESDLAKSREFDRKAAEIQEKHGINVRMFINDNLKKYTKQKNPNLSDIQDSFRSQSKKNNGISFNLLRELFDTHIYFNGQKTSAIKTQYDEAKAKLDKLKEIKSNCRFVSDLDASIGAIEDPILIVTSQAKLETLIATSSSKNIDVLGYRLQNSTDVPTSPANNPKGVKLISLDSTKLPEFTSQLDTDITGAFSAKYISKPFLMLNTLLDNKPLKVGRYGRPGIALFAQGVGSAKSITAGKGSIHLTPELLTECGVAHSFSEANGQWKLQIENFDSPAVQASLQKVYDIIYSGQPGILSWMTGR